VSKKKKNAKRNEGGTVGPAGKHSIGGGRKGGGRGKAQTKRRGLGSGGGKR